MPKSKNPILRVARVQYIILDEDDGRVYDALGKEESIGTIFFSWLNKQSPANSRNLNNYITAKPLHYNISHYPVPNELVYIIAGPSNTYNENGVFDYYYLAPLSIYKDPSSNAYPDQLDENYGFYKGRYFKENEVTRPLRPYEGDILFEGRFGQSIRFGSTIDNSKTHPPNHWSNTGKIGNPITIIRNGQKIEPNQPSSKHITEDINDDASSIYLCTYQQISNFIPASIHDDSYHYDVFTLQKTEEPNINNSDLDQNVVEDQPLHQPNDIPPEEIQLADELSDIDIENPEIAHFDVAPTEKGIHYTDNLNLGDSYIIPEGDNKINETLGQANTIPPEETETTE